MSLPDSNTEFSALRAEITSRIGMLDNTVRQSYYVVVLIYTFAVALVMVNYNVVTYVMPLVVALPSYILVVNITTFRECLVQMQSDASYISTFFEKKMPHVVKGKSETFESPSWETSSAELVGFCDSKRIADPVGFWDNRVSIYASIYWLLVAVLVLSFLVFIFIGGTLWYGMYPVSLEELQAIFGDGLDRSGFVIVLTILYLAVIAMLVMLALKNAPDRFVKNAFFYPYLRWQQFALDRNFITKKEFEENMISRGGIRIASVPGEKEFEIWIPRSKKESFDTKSRSFICNLFRGTVVDFGKNFGNSMVDILVTFSVSDGPNRTSVKLHNGKVRFFLR